MDKETPVTFEEIYRLSVERDRYIKQREEDTKKLNQLTSEIEKVKLLLDKGSENIALVEGKIRAVGLALAEHDPKVSRDLLRGRY